ncbi:MAG: Rne/Rng family ribonuclease [Candidatus Auribacterota bacterium]|nr:Rne/Rng family ribonuclease [Candidatus Auribacterota bacterium]
MKKELIINCNPSENRVAVLTDGKLEQFFLQRDEKQSPLGNIYKGKVTTILHGLGAAFVSIGLEKDGFLPMGETARSSSLWDDVVDNEANNHKKTSSKKPSRTIEHLLRKKQDIIVQVVKEPISSKGARLTTQISLPGRYLVLTPLDKRIGISRKITRRDERSRLRKIMGELKGSKDVGVIVRTAAAAATKKNLKKDLSYLMNSWKSAQKKENKSGAPALLHEELGLVLKVVRDSLLTDVEHIIVDSKTEYKNINRFLASFSPQTQSKLVHYRGRKPLFDKHNLEEIVAKTFKPKIWLKCGGHIVINQTEALVAVDVNTGKHKGKNDQEKTVLTANLEAAVEVAHQLRLRNMGGIIVIDFIDMSSRRYQKRVLSALLKELKKDKARTRVLPFSEFGLIQLTRQREEESFLKKVYETCPYCNGLGVVKSLFSLGLEIERRLRSGAFKYPKIKRFRIEASPYLARYLLEEGWDQLRRYARRRGIRISIIDNSELGFQEYKIWALSSRGQEQV